MLFLLNFRLKFLKDRGVGEGKLFSKSFLPPHIISYIILSHISIQIINEVGDDAIVVATELKLASILYRIVSI